ncbi:MAG: hypothetical protein AB7U38_15200, partial [Hyphomicrobiales bacterium]
MPPSTAVAVWSGCRTLFGDGPHAEGMASITCARLKAIGATRHYCHDALNDPESLAAGVSISREAGLDARPVLLFTRSPAHDDSHFAERAAALAQLSPRSVCLYDPGGLLLPERAGELLRRLVDSLDGVALEFRGAAYSGQAERVCLDAVAAGASVVHAVAEPLAGGFSLPPVRYFHENLRREGVDTGLDMAAYGQFESYLSGLADLNDLPVGRHGLPDWGYDRHQLTDALRSDCLDELRAAGAADTSEALLDEVARVRADFGYPAMVPPLDAAIARVAVRNLIDGKRYGADFEAPLVRIAAKLEGEPAGDVAEEVMKRARKVSDSAPAMPDGEGDDAVLEAHCSPEELEQVRAGRGQLLRDLEHAASDTVEEFLLNELQHRAIRHLSVRKGAFSLSLDWA